MKMVRALDPEIASALMAAATAAAASGQFELPAPGDVTALRAFIDAGLEPTFAQLPDAPAVVMTIHDTAAQDGGAIPLRWYTPGGARGSAAVIYFHGGGMIAGTAAGYDRVVRHYVQATGVAFLSVDYRLAPEHSQTGLAQDGLAALRFVLAETERLGIDPGRIAVMGDSGGGGIAAAVAILARDHGIPLARQILIYPMLDDRNTRPDPLLAPTALWRYDQNHTAWTAVLGDALGTDGVSPSLAPARLTDFSGLAPAYIEVGELDIFCDESLRYAAGLLAAGVSCELHLHPGAPHAYDWINLASGVSRRALDDRARVIGAI